MRVVVVGGGFGGVKAALELSKRQIGKITLISDQPYFLHHATLYATATGKSTEESVIPLNLIFANHPNVEIVEDTVISFDPSRKLVSSRKRDYKYDKLVLALGSTTDFFNIKGLEKHAFGIKSLEEVREFQDHIYQSVIREKLDKEYFVIGAGPTGVEMAGALNEYLGHLIAVNRIKNTKPRVTLVEAAPRILPVMSKSASRIVTKELKKQGVRILVNHKVTALADNKITIEGRVYPTTTAIWTSGVTNNDFFSNQANSVHFDFAKNRRVVVNPFLEALDHVYVIGDNNNMKYSGMALPAMKQATHAAKNIARTATRRAQKKFRPFSVPTGLPVGSRWGYVEWYGMYLSGRLGAIVRRHMELYGYCQLVSRKVALPIWRSHDISDVDDIF